MQRLQKIVTCVMTLSSRVASETTRKRLGHPSVEQAANSKTPLRETRDRLSLRWKNAVGPLDSRDAEAY